MKAVRRVFVFLARKKNIKENPCILVKNIPVRKKDIKNRGCVELGKVKGIFDKRWKSEESRLLNMIIYTTGMRNSEIGRIKLEDIVEVRGVKFVEVKESKTESGERLVPLHENVYKAIKAYAKNKKKDVEIFNLAQREKFARAVAELGKHLKMSAEELEKENITFYSGRHYWKTLMNAEGLGDEIEEVFMGHRVSGNVAETYNHRDKRGQGALVKEARQVFTILDKRVFGRGRSASEKSVGQKPVKIKASEKNKPADLLVRRDRGAGE